MPTLWSELSGPRTLEVTADTATGVWIAGWGWVGWLLYDHLARLAGAGRAVREAGVALDAAGKQIDEVFARVPVIGHAAGEGLRQAFAATASPLLGVGGDLERALLITAVALGMIVAVVPIAIWLQRYLPWRLQRVSMLRAASSAIRVAPRLHDAELERLLAARAIHRLSYPELLRYTPDPFGDWTAGRYERLASAELASVGLRRYKPRYPKASGV
ncbi:MAG: hypothetical protein ACT4P5_02085 [Armatimonadota bacterium]